MTLTRLTLIHCALTILAFGGQDEDEKRLSEAAVTRKLSLGAFDRSDFRLTMTLPDSPALISALKSAFIHAADDRQKIPIAAALVGTGDADPDFFTYLKQAGEARIADNAPSWMEWSGQPKGELSTEFLTWCSLNGVDPKKEAARQWDAGDDIEIIGLTDDPRFDEFMVRALKARNEAVSFAAAKILARRRANYAIPAILGICKTQPEKSYQMRVGLVLAEFGTFEADRELSRIVKDPATISYLKRLFGPKQVPTDRARLGLSYPGHPGASMR